MKTTPSKLKIILITWLFAGTLDILCAIFLLANGNAIGVFRYIAKAVFGEMAFKEGFEMVVFGAVSHYFIALCFVAGYFFMAVSLPFLRNYKIVGGLLYGIFIWAFMQFLVLPLTHNIPEPVTFRSAWKNCLILMVAVGLPTSLFTHYYYYREKKID